MAVTATELRRNLYKLLDEVLETREPLLVELKGERLRIEPADMPSKLDRLVPHPDFIIGDPDELIHMDWFDEWNPDPA